MSGKAAESWVDVSERWLWQAELGGDSRWKKRGWHALRVLFAVLRDILDGQINLHAMSLVYTTLLSIVPFLALSFSVLKGFGVHNQLKPLLEQLLIAPLGPEKGQIVVQNVLSFVDNIEVGVLGSVGLAILVYTVVSLVQKIEYSFNEIWRIGQSRSLAQRFSNYLSVIMIGPLLVFAALGATAALVNSDPVKQLTEVEPVAWAVIVGRRVLPYVVIIGLFTFLYAFIPNTKVKLRHALAGGIVAGLIWQTAGFAFTIFAATSTNYDAIYSGFAVGIMLLIWLYLAWLILLIGASVAYYAQHAPQISRTREVFPSASLDESSGLAIVYRVARNFDQDGGSTSLSDIESTFSISAEPLRRISEKLVAHGILTTTGDENERLIPARSLDRISMEHLLTVLRSPDESMPLALQSHAAVTDIVNAIDEALATALKGKTVSAWVREQDHPVGTLAAPEPFNPELSTPGLPPEAG